MKRIISIICVFCLILAGIPAVAGAAEETPEKPLNLSFSDVESLVKKNNIIYRNNQTTIRSLNDSLSDSVLDTLMASRNELQTYLDYTKRVVGQLAGFIPDTPTYPADYDTLLLQSVVLSLNNDIGSYIMSIAQIDMQIDQFYTMPRLTIDSTILQLESINKQIIWGAESLFTAYHALSRQIDLANENLKTLNRNIKALEHRFSLGQITESTLLDIKSTGATLKLGIGSMENELVNLKGQINMLLGRKYDEPININKLPDAQPGFLKTVDAEKDLRSAKNQSYLISVAEMEIDEYSRGINTSQQNKYAIAKNNYTNEVRAIEFKYDSLSRAITDKEAALASSESQLVLRQKQLENTKVRYRLGLVSKLALDQAESDVLIQTISVDSANAELFTAIRRYEWLIRGLSV